MKKSFADRIHPPACLYLKVCQPPTINRRQLTEMCGICGIAGNTNPSVIERMTLSLTHRGPDDGDVEVFPDHKLALGHRRLSVIDLSPQGRQPMANQRCAGGEDG